MIDKSLRKATAQRFGDVIVIRMTGGGDCAKCPLYPAKGESGECPGCINNVLRNAAWMLKVDGDSYKGGCV